MLKLTLGIYLIEYYVVRKLNRAAGRMLGREVASPALEEVAKEQSRFMRDLLDSLN